MAVSAEAGLAAGGSLMANVIRLLGTPSIEIDGVPVTGPRGRKSWAVLALAVLSDRPPERSRVARLLFPDAGDPLGALRWALAELRRALGGSASMSGDPLVLQLAERTVVDVLVVPGSRDLDPSGLSQLSAELLAGMTFSGCDAFESWLLVERRRLAAAAEATIHEAAMARLGAGRPLVAVRFAARAVELNPFEESHHTLLVRSLAASGDRAAALAAAESCGDLFRRELGADPSRAVREAVDVAAGATSAPRLTGVAAARAQLQAGKAAIVAGAVDAGLDCLRRAVHESRFADDDDLIVAALTELGSALVHSVRGRDDEGAVVLHEAIDRAARASPAAAATACRELGFVDVQAGRRERSALWLDRARELAGDDDGALAAIGGVRGMMLSDQGRYPEALDVLTDSVARALRCESRRQAAWSASQIGRLQLLRGDAQAAHRALAQSLQLVRSERWLAFFPWPESFSAELDALDGRTRQAERRLTEAFALACQLGDPCWEGITARGLGLLESRHDPDAALARLRDALARCVRWPDAYQWVRGYVLDAMCTVAAAAGDVGAPALADDMLRLAARTDMRELVVRAHLHRARLGIPGALDAAQMAAASIDNPALGALSAAGVAAR
jgi:DNA-binding SARP family transcriptional activator